MNKSDSISNLTAALVKAQADFPAVPKTKEVIVNSSRGNYAFRYAPLEDMLRIIRPILAAHGLGVVQGAQGETLETTIIHASGEWISHAMPLTDPGTAQAYGAQITYKRRYGLKAALGIETDDDNSEEQQETPRKPGRPSAPITPTTGAWDHIEPVRQEILRRIGSGVIDYFADGDTEGGYRYLQTQIAEKNIDNDEKVAMWTMFDSRQRSTLKRFAKEEAMRAIKPTDQPTATRQ